MSTRVGFTIFDDKGFEEAFICRQCEEVRDSLWGGICKKCETDNKRHKEIIEAIKLATNNETKKS